MKSMKAALLLSAAFALLAGCDGQNMHYEPINKKPIAATCEMPCCKDKAAVMMDGKCCMDCCDAPATAPSAATKPAGHVH